MTKIKKRKKGFYIYAFFSCLAAFNSLLKLGCEWDANKQPSAVANRPARQNRAVDRA